MRGGGGGGGGDSIVGYIYYTSRHNNELTLKTIYAHKLYMPYSVNPLPIFSSTLSFSVHCCIQYMHVYTESDNTLEVLSVHACIY